MEAVSTVFGVPTSAIISRIRSENIAAARHALVYILRERQRMSYPEIGRTMERDHTSVMHSYRTSLDLLEKDEDFRKKLFRSLEIYGEFDAPNIVSEPESGESIS